MSGQLVKRGINTWLVRIPLGRDAKGKRLYHNRTVKGSKKDAERYRTKTLRELHTGMFVEPSQQPVHSFLRAWLSNTVAHRVRPKTLADYTSLVERYIIPSIGNKALCSVTSRDVQAIYSAMQDRGLSPRTIRYAHSVLNSALQSALRWQLIAVNPARLVDLPRQVRREMRSLSADEAASFLAAAKDTRFEALWTILLTAGLRPCEALALKWSDLLDDRLQIRRSLAWVPQQGPVFSEPKTAGGRRVVSLPTSTLKALRTHRTRQAVERLAAGPSWKENDLVFATHTGGPLEWRVVVSRYFRPLLRAAGLTALRPYDLRHTCASLLLAAGENVKVVSERLGHATATMTLDVYAHVLPDMQQRASERLEALLFPRAGSSGAE